MSRKAALIEDWTTVILLSIVGALTWWAYFAFSSTMVRPLLIYACLAVLYLNVAVLGPVVSESLVAAAKWMIGGRPLPVWVVVWKKSIPQSIGGAVVGGVALYLTARIVAEACHGWLQLMLVGLIGVAGLLLLLIVVDSIFQGIKAYRRYR